MKWQSKYDPVRIRIANDANIALIKVSQTLCVADSIKIRSVKDCSVSSAAGAILKSPYQGTLYVCKRPAPKENATKTIYPAFIPK